jgi:hypothetical protein
MPATCPAHLILRDIVLNYTWRRLQVMKLLTVQLSPTSCHFIPLWSKYSPQHHVLKQCRHEADHSPPYNVEVRKDGAIPPLPHASSRRPGIAYGVSGFWELVLKSGRIEYCAELISSLLNSVPHISSSVLQSLIFRRFMVEISVQRPAILTEVSHYFPQALQASVALC